jgi:6-phosphogluconolactonase (cycloisomerase 2 family)
MDRRAFNVALASATVTSMYGCTTTAPRTSGRVTLYSSIGDTITQYDVDVDAGTLAQRGSLKLPSEVQYAWHHPSHRYLYATTSDAQDTGSGKASGNVHRLVALKRAEDGALSFHGEPQALAQRPIFNSVDHTGNFSLTCYPAPTTLSVHPIDPDGTLGAAIPQQAKLDMGIFAHQIRATPTNRSVVLVTRGINATEKQPESPGALKVFRFDNGQLSPLESVVVGGRGGLGYGPRHLAFHPSKPWVYVGIERQNQVMMHVRSGDAIAAEPSFIKSTTIKQYEGLPQPVVAGTIHVHPGGHTVYTSNRASRTVDFNGKQVFAGGENSIVVFSINPATGEPTAVQHEDPRGFHVRAFAIDPSGRLLVAATMLDMLVRDGNEVRRISAGLSVFRIGADGKITFVRKYDVKTGGAQQLWVSMV